MKLGIHYVCRAENVFKVTGQRSRSQRDQMHFSAEAYMFRRCGVEAHVILFDYLYSFIYVNLYLSF